MASRKSKLVLLLVVYSSLPVYEYKYRVGVSGKPWYSRLQSQKVSEKDKSSGKSSTNPVGFVKTPKTQFNQGEKQNAELIKKIVFQVCIRISVTVYIEYYHI